MNTSQHAARPKVPAGPRSKGKISRNAAFEQLAALVRGQRVDRREDGAPRATSAWLISGAFNLAIIITAVCILIKAAQGNGEKERAIIIPQSFEDPSLSQHPGGIPHAGSDDPMKDAMQNLTKIIKDEGWSQSKTPQDLSGLLGGTNSDGAVEGIFRGAGGAMGDSGGPDAGGKVAAFGASGGGAGVGPKSSFYGTGGNASRIVYILDHSGSMIDNYEFLKVETRHSINNLVPLQSVGIVMFADRAETLPPGTLVRALPDAKKALLAAMDLIPAQGPNDDYLPPFQSAFQRAFEMKPQLIYFLTDGKFDPKLLDVVANLNADKAVSINTLAFVTEDAGYKDLLQKLAKDNNGVYKFVAEKELGR